MCLDILDNMLEKFWNKKVIPEEHRTEMENLAKREIDKCFSYWEEKLKQPPFNFEEKLLTKPRVGFYYAIEKSDDPNEYGKYVIIPPQIKINIEKIYLDLIDIYKINSTEEQEIFSGVVYHEFAHHVLLSILHHYKQSLRDLNALKLVENCTEYLSACMMKDFDIGIDAYLRFTIKNGYKSQLKDMWKRKYLRYKNERSHFTQTPGGWERAKMLRFGYKENNPSKALNAILGLIGKRFR